MSFWHDKIVIVAGGAGFIGQHLVQALLNAHASVHVIDNHSTGRALEVQPRTQQQLTQQHHDICTPTMMPKADVVYNLASPASPVHYQGDPIQTWKTNVLGTLKMLEHALDCGATLVQASTSEVYGDPLSHPQKETDWGNVNPIGPRACYDESKRAAEALLMDAVRTASADVRIARIFNTYGPGMTDSDGRAIPNFATQAEQGTPLTIYGDGTQTRSFCHVSDTVEGLMRLGMVDAAKGQVINIGNPTEVTILEIAQQINALFGNKSDIVFEDRPVDDPQRRCPDIGRAESLLDWTPQMKLQDGLITLHQTGQIRKSA
ncbi:GDP-mannose 4,6-dehydratase [Yoonia sp. GPGPB17]|uniref:NAD-dependent epimerase/dehydratase family protein n=1 Tax=Yoonia sp. GPGPB17 TaxID=3026147 RepID=UPI0030C24E40